MVPVVIVAAIVAVVAVVAVVGWMVAGRRHPESAADHRASDRHGADRWYGDATDRPAGPDAEAQAVVEPGEIAPGPHDPPS